jgi:hypothetical protein
MGSSARSDPFILSGSWTRNTGRITFVAGTVTKGSPANRSLATGQAVKISDPFQFPG